MKRTAPICLLFLCLGVAPAFAGEQKAPAKSKDAEAIGRGLISEDDAVRDQAVAALQKAMSEGRADTTYLDALSKAASTWADNTDRLAEVWIERAVEGDARERRIAVRLLHALGPDAVERLALELRHQRHRPTATQAQGAAAPPVLDAPAPPIKDNRIAKIYHVKALAKSGMHALKIRSFLQKSANASEVVPYGDRYMVLAEAEGHRALADALAKHQAQQLYEAAQRAAPPPAQVDEPPADPKEELKAEAPKAKPSPLVEVEPQPASPAKWRLHAAVIQVPRDEATILYGEEEAQSRVLLRQGSLEAGRDWIEATRKLPDARELVRGAPLVLANNQGGSISAGKVFHYNKRVEPAKGGAYKIVSGELHHGYIFEFRPKENAKATVLTIQTTRVSISMPVPIRVVRPAKDAAPIEIQEPQWSRTRSNTSVTLGSIPTSIMLVFQGLDEQQPNDDVVLVVTIEHNTDSYRLQRKRGR